jgi:hypothetical protein
MNDSKIYSIAKKLYTETSGANFREFFKGLKYLLGKYKFYFLRFKDEDFFKLIIFTYQLYIHQDENLSLEFLLEKSEESNLFISLYTDFNEVMTFCDDCDGDGRESCYNCLGSETEECPQCEGRGVDEDGEVCEECNGNGEVECSVCDGQGSFDCDTCYGVGEVEDLEQTQISLQLYLLSDPLFNNNFSDGENNKVFLIKDESKERKYLLNCEIYDFNENIDATEKMNFDSAELYLIGEISDLKTKGMLLKRFVDGNQTLVERYMKESLNSIL